MSLLSEIKDKAKNLINMSEPYLIRQTKSYDASKNRVIVAGYVLDGVVESSINSDVMTRQEQGIDYYYTVPIQSFEQRVLSVTILPTATCLDQLRLLALKQQQSSGWFNISVHENNTLVNVYRGWILSLPEIAMSQDSANRTVTFAIKSMGSNTLTIDQPTDFENKNYSQWGVAPDKAGQVSTIDEVSGVKVREDESTYYPNGVPMLQDTYYDPSSEINEEDPNNLNQ